MAGICGWIASAAREERAEEARGAMLAALRHRGGVSSLDWAAGAEPELGPGPVVADTAFNTDTEIASAWAAWSSDPSAFASRLRGSFAAAALDRKRGRLVLARDPLGEKPLYYVAGPRGVAFASEIKALRAAGLVDLSSICAEAIDAYLAFTYIPAPWTIHEQVRKVPAGHVVEIDLGGPAAEVAAVSARRYWRMPDRVGESATPDEMLARLAAALSRRMPAGEAGIFLSGGLDSSVVAALAAREAGAGGAARLRSFSIGFAEAALDESRHALRVAEIVGTKHERILLRDVDPETVARVIDALDEPMADAACVPTWVMAQQAAKETGVVLTGDGADALLAGDHWFRRLATLDRLDRLPRIVRSLVPAISALAGPRALRRRRDLISLLDRPPAERYLRIREKWTWEDRRSVYAEEFRRRIDPARAAATYVNSPVEWRTGESVDAAIRLDSIHGLPEDLLMKADKMCLAHGLESRSPFLDRELVEWAARLEIGLLLKGRSAKDLLKRAAERLLPRDLVHRRKHGFQAPVERWLKGPLRPMLEDAFSAATVGGAGVFDPAALASLRARFDAGPAGPALTGKIWQIVAFGTWWRRTVGPS